jgi:hypothetical protein
MLLNEDSQAAIRIAKMCVILISSTGYMGPSNRVCRHTRRENPEQLHYYPAQKSIYKSTPSSIILVSPYVHPSPAVACAQHQTSPHDNVADSIFPIESVTC